MALFDVITGLGSLYGGIQADNERRRAMNQAAMLRQQGLDQMAKSLEMANVNYQQRLQSGAYDPTKEMQAAGQQSALNFRNALGSRMTNKGGDTFYYDVSLCLTFGNVTNAGTSKINATNVVAVLAAV